MADQVAEFWSFPTNPAEFESDDRISYSKLENKYIAVQEDGTEYEFDIGLKRWIPIIDDALIEEHQAAYAPPVNSRDEGHDGIGTAKKRKHDDTAAGNNANRRISKRQATGGGGGSTEPRPPAPKQNTAIYVTGLPLDATLEEVTELFSRKCGVIAEEIDGNRPRIKMYTDDRGQFKGDALIVFFKPQSVDMAIMLLDDTHFRLTASGVSAGRIRVQAADASYKKTSYDQEQQPRQTRQQSQTAGASDRADGGSGGGSSSNRSNGGERTGTSAPSTAARQRSVADKHKIIKKTQKLDAKLADWDDDDPYPAVADERLTRKDRIVILKHMFTLQELENDPAALLEIKEDVREECEKLGEVTNVVLFDLEEEGVVSIKFRSPEAAVACIRLMDGRSFDGRTVEAALATGKEKYRKSKNKDGGDDEEFN